jgi:hypothetical protein
MPLSLINPLTEASTIATNVVNNSAQTNYIAFPVATSDPTSNGWRVYADSAANLPVDGEGGSPNTTLTQNTSTPLSSTGDFRLTKNSGASRQGEGISTDFTIANRHLGKVLQISFDYELITGALATDDLRIYIIQEPTSVNRVVIEPVSVSIQGTISGNRIRHLATFQTHISITSYRLCVHVATTTNSVQTIDFNNFRVWESVQSVGSITTDWQSYTPTIQGNSGGTLTGFSWRRVGGNLEIQGRGQFGTTSSSEFRFSLPSGLIISSIFNIANSQVGFLNTNNLQSTAFKQWVLLATSGNSYLCIGHSGDAYNFSSSVPSLSPQTTDNITTNCLFTLQASIPITGWGSSVAMSSDSGDGRVVACSYQGNPSFTTGNFFGFPTRRFDTHNAYNTSTGEFTVPISGLYRVSTTMGSSAAADIVYASLDGSTYAYLFQTPSSTTYVSSGSVVVEARAGQRISLVKSTSSSLYSGNTQMGIYVERIAGSSQVISTVETVACSYTATSNTPSVTSSAPLILPVRIYDTHGAYNSISGIFTAPIAGKYFINLVSAIGGGVNVFVYKNNNIFSWIGRADYSYGELMVNFTIDLLAGNTMDIRTNSSGAPAVFNGGTLGNSSVTVLNIHRIGL